jgi:hypothetical protein
MRLRSSLRIIVQLEVGKGLEMIGSVGVTGVELVIFTVTDLISLGVHPVVLHNNTLYEYTPFVLFESENFHFCA